jgi:hypothetical protein
VRLIHQAGCKINGIGITASTVVSTDESPEISNNNGVAVTVGQCPHEEVGARVEDIDRAVAEISDQQVVGKGAKPSGRYVEPPRGVENPAGGDALDEVAVRVKFVDKAVTRPGDIVVLGGVLQA